MFISATRVHVAIFCLPPERYDRQQKMILKGSFGPFPAVGHSAPVEISICTLVADKNHNK